MGRRDDEMDGRGPGRCGRRHTDQCHTAQRRARVRYHSLGRRLDGFLGHCHRPPAGDGTLHRRDRDDHVTHGLFACTHTHTHTQKPVRVGGGGVKNLGPKNCHQPGQCEKRFPLSSLPPVGVSRKNPEHLALDRAAAGRAQAASWRLFSRQTGRVWNSRVQKPPGHCFTKTCPSGKSASRATVPGKTGNAPRPSAGVRYTAVPVRVGRLMANSAVLVDRGWRTPHCASA
jgi:hypothetical protein